MRRLAAVIFLIAASTPLRAQRPGPLPTDTLAVVGSQVITARDYIERVELMPWPGKDRGGMRDSAKIAALQSLVAERLLAAEANTRGLPLDSITLSRRNTLERMLVRDELYRREVVAHAPVRPEDLRKGLQRYPFTISVLFLRTASLEDARTLSRLLKEPRPPGAEVRNVPEHMVLSADSLDISYGGNDWTMEDSSFALNAKHQISGGFQSDLHGCGVLYLLRGKRNPEAANNPRVAVEKVLRQRAQEARAAAYTRSTLAGLRAEANPRLFTQAALALRTRIAVDPSAHFKSGGFLLTPADFDSAAASLRPIADSVLVAIPSGPITVSQMLEQLRDLDVRFTALDTTAFQDQLNSHVRSAVRAELMSREAMRQGLQHSEPVTRDLNTWSDAWRASAVELQTRRGATSTDTDALEFLIRHAQAWGNAYEVNIREILTDSIATAMRLLDSLNMGADMATLARRHSKRPGWSARGGESGFFYVSSLPEVGVPALYLDSGAVGGPYHHLRGYSIVTRLGLRRGEGGMALDSLIAGARTAARLEKAQRLVNTEVARLARESQVTMYYDRLARVTITPSNMVTKRYIGFGGIMMAVPTIHPIWQWVKDAPNVREVLP